jgi:hypothetical protein
MWDYYLSYHFLSVVFILGRIMVFGNLIPSNRKHYGNKSRKSGGFCGKSDQPPTIKTLHLASLSEYIPPSSHGCGTMKTAQQRETHEDWSARSDDGILRGSSRSGYGKTAKLRGHAKDTGTIESKTYCDIHFFAGQQLASVATAGSIHISISISMRGQRWWTGFRRVQTRHRRHSTTGDPFGRVTGFNLVGVLIDSNNML